jgi:hypothetical protein
MPSLGNNDAPSYHAHALSFAYLIHRSGLTMTSWRREYLTALENRDKNEKANIETSNTCNKPQSTKA